MTLELDLDVSGDDESVTLAFRSDIDLATVGAFADALQDCLGRRPRRLCLDLSGVGFMSSEGVRVLCETTKRCSRGAIQLQIIASRPVRRVVEVAGASHLLPIVA
jgi:anti-anti-sigma factor